MNALVWSSRFLTGIASVDVQHQKLVGLINTFGALCARHAEVPRAQLEAIVDELERYSQTHFSDEEAFMDASGLVPRFVASHKSQHARFLREVDRMRASHFLDAPETSRVLLRFLIDWLAFHILGTDMQLARQVERLSRGEDPELAFAAEVREVDGPAQLLLGALDDLQRIIAERNAELAQANRTLEARVSAAVETLQATQAKLVETEKLASVGQLAAGLAHEINNPLAFITANVNALGEHARALLRVAEAAQQVAPLLPQAQREVLAQASAEADLDFVRQELAPLLSETREGVKRVQTIVRDLKDFAQVDSSAVVDLDLKHAVETTLKVLPARHREGVSFVTAFGSVPRVRCQAAQVNQALLSLVQNATQAVGERPGARGVVSISTSVEGAFAVITVHDTGVGMAPEVLSRVFEPFFTTRPPGQGTGLGLTVAYNCARAHGGQLEASSTPGEGSTFRLLLPLERPATTEATTPA